MPEIDLRQKPLRITSVIASLTAGGIGPVCRYAAEGMAKSTNWRLTLLSLHDPVSDQTDEVSGLRIVCLGLDRDCARRFLEWLAENPQDLIITSDVCQIESAFPVLPQAIRHVVQIHDSGRRYRAVAVRHAAWVDGVTCVGNHIETPLQRSLTKVGFRGLLRTVHNGASFPPLIPRQPYEGPLRLLFMGRVDALKGAFDLVPLLMQLKQLRVPVTLKIVGGENLALRRQFQRKQIADMVTWSGRVPHEQCYPIAAKSDLLLLPTRKESFGMVTIEAMSMGCVPIAYDIPSGSTEIIAHGKSGLLVPLGDIRAWAEQVRTLDQDRRWLMRLSEDTVVRARTCFDSKTMSQNLTTYLGDVMDQAESSPATREPGLPLESAATIAGSRRGYQRLPAGFRDWIRNRVHSNPHVSHWLLSR